MSRDKRQALMAALVSAIRAHQRAVDALDEAAAAFLRINRTDLRCLDVLMERGGATPGHVAGALGLTTGSVTTMLDRLEKLGYVQRTPDPSDRRRVDVRATPAALKAAAPVYGPIAVDGGRIIDRYSGPELELLLDFLRRDRELQETHRARIRGLRRKGDRR